MGEEGSGRDEGRARDEAQRLRLCGVTARASGSADSSGYIADGVCGKAGIESGAALTPTVKAVSCQGCATVGGRENA